jgi:hypothetical protein
MGYCTVVCLMIWEGGAWAHGFYAENVGGYTAGTVAALFGWYLFGRGYSNSRKEWLRFTAKCALGLASFTVSFFACEIAIRAILLQRQQGGTMAELTTARAKSKPLRIKSTHPLALIIQLSENPKLVYTLETNLNLTFGHRSLRTNRDGMRDSLDYDKERAPGSVRIVGIGDSGMFGWDVDQDEDYLSLLENKLNGRNNGVSYECLNLGTPGYNTELEVECLREKGLHYRPDIVIVGWCNNDYYLPFFVRQSENFRRRDVSFLYMGLFRREAFKELASGAVFRDRRTFDYNLVSPDLLAGTEVKGVTRSLRELQDHGGTHGFKILVFGPMDEGIIGICQRLGLPYVNTVEAIPSGLYPQEWGVHMMHPRPEGHRVIANCLHSELERLGWL